MGSGFYDTDGIRDVTQSSLTWNALIVKDTIYKLCCLRKLTLLLFIKSENNEGLAQGLYQLLKDIQVRNYLTI